MYRYTIPHGADIVAVSRADSTVMDMTANVTLTGPALDIQHAVMLIEEWPMGGPVAGVHGAWQWQSQREDIVDRVISHSMEFPDIRWDVEGIEVNGFRRNEVTLNLANGSGVYTRTEFDKVHKRIPSDIDYDSLTFEYEVRDGKASLTQVMARKFRGMGHYSSDVTRYFR